MEPRKCRAHFYHRYRTLDQYSVKTIQFGDALEKRDELQPLERIIAGCLAQGLKGGLFVNRVL
jgi:hypothetical protein